MKTGGVAEGKIRVLIADAQNLFREGLRLMLRQEENIEIVGEAVNGVQLINQIPELKPDVVLLDLNMPDLDRLELISAVKNNGARSIALTAEMDENTVLESLKAGALGHLSKNTTSSNVLKAIRAVHKGEMWVERKMITRVFEHQFAPESDGKDNNEQREGLSPREREVLSLLVKGFTNKEIAENLFVSEKTVKNHLNSVFRKIGVSGRLKAILYALKHGLQ